MEDLLVSSKYYRPSPMKAEVQVIFGVGLHCPLAMAISSASDKSEASMADARCRQLQAKRILLEDNKPETWRQSGQ